MSEDKFTPGPWRIEEFRDFTSIMAGYREICYIDDDLNRHENAMIIAAAPEMHKLLRRIESYFKNRHIYGQGVDESVSKKLMSRIERVMKKADCETGDEE